MRPRSWLTDYIVRVVWPLLVKSQGWRGRAEGYAVLSGEAGAAALPAPAGSAATGTLAALTPANRFVARLSTGLAQHDGTLPTAQALLGGGMCATGGVLGAKVPYQTSGPIDVGVTGWVQDVPLYPNAVGGMVPRGDPTLAGIFSRECGVYDGTYFSVAIGQTEGF